MPLESQLPGDIYPYTDTNFEAYNFDYGDDYPEGLKLKPGTEAHKRLVDSVLKRASASWDVMSSRHTTWNEITDSLTAYITVTDKEQKVLDTDARKPVSIVVPQLYTTLDTLLTYTLDVLMGPKTFRYRGVGPEDIVGNALLEHVVQAQVDRFKMGLDLHTMWRDSYAYGLGACAPIWTTQYGKRLAPVTRNKGKFSQVLDRFLGAEVEYEYEDYMLFEGNRLDSIAPQSLLPDPNVSAHRIQDAEYVGWVSHENRLALLDRERQGDEGLFNVKYLRYTGPLTSKYNPRSEDQRQRHISSYMRMESATNPVDVVYMVISLVPEEWKLGKSEYPEKWIFGVAGDRILIMARPLGLDHDMFPIGICAPEYDGYTISPISRLETVYGLQKAINWMFNSHVTNVRKALNDMFIVDPQRVNMNDLKDPGPGRLVRLRKQGWGQGVEGAIKQLSVVDVTSGNIDGMISMIDLMQRTTGATDSLQGITRQTSERKTAQEVRDVRSSAASRLDRVVTLMGMQGMHDLGYLIAAQTQQLMSEETWVNIVGDFGQILQDEYGASPEQAQGLEMSNGRVKISPDMLNIPFDVVPFSNAQRGAEYAQQWVTMLQTVSASEELSSKIDVYRIFLRVARMMGVRDIHQFKRVVNQTQLQTMPDEQVADQVQRGNLRPLG